MIISYNIFGLQIDIDIPLLIISGVMSIMFFVGRNLIYKEFDIMKEFKHNKILMIIPLATNVILALFVIASSVTIRLKT